MVRLWGGEGLGDVSSSSKLKNTKETVVFLMPQIPFEFECERSNDLCMAELSFSCSEIFALFY